MKIEQDTETRTSRFIFVCHDFIIKKLQALLSRSESHWKVWGFQYTRVTTVDHHDRDALQLCSKVKCDSPAPCARGTCYLYHPFIPWHQNSYSPHCSLCISCDWQGEFVYWSRVFYRARLIEAFWEFFSSQKFISIPSILTIVRIQSPCWTQFRPSGTQRFSKSRVFFENREAPGYKILIHERQRMHVWKSRGLWLIILWRFVFHLRRSDEFCFFLIIIS